MKNRIQQHVATQQPHGKTSSRTVKQRSKAVLPNIQGWYQLRKRGVQRLRNLSGGKIEIAEVGYRGHSVDHWLRHLECGGTFRGSVQGLSHLDAADACPFCSPWSVDDMRRYGSVQAVRELVLIMSSGTINFCEANTLGRSDDLYEFICTIRRCRFTATFKQFLADPDYLCPFCQPTRPGRS